MCLYYLNITEKYNMTDLNKQYACPFCHGDLELVATYNFMIEYKCTSCRTTVERIVEKGSDEVDKNSPAYIEEAKLYAHAREFGDRF